MGHLRWLLAVSACAFVAVAAACGGSSSSDVTSSTDPDAGSAQDSSAAATDASHPSDAGTDARDGGSDPIVAPNDQWTWVDFPDSKCASGKPTGIGVNPHAGSTELVIYMEGGGACADGASCWGPSPTATNLTGFDATTFAAAQQLKYPLLNRTLAANPFAAKNLVYVPYCTGDMHGGSAEAMLTNGSTTIPTYFWGARDVDLFLQRLVPTFKGTTRVWLWGTSAGGFGTMLNFDRVSTAFGVRVDIIDDSGPPIAAKGATDNKTLFTTWGYAPPAGCTGCESLAAIYAFDRQKQPASRYAFLSFAQDTVIAPRFGYDVAEFPAVVDTFSTSIANDANAATYIVTNKASHVVESDVTLTPQYGPWLVQMITDDAAWKSAVYMHP